MAEYKSPTIDGLIAAHDRPADDKDLRCVMADVRSILRLGVRYGGLDLPDDAVVVSTTCDDNRYFKITMRSKKWKYPEHGRPVSCLECSHHEGAYNA